ncbi:MAG: hypothetical protein QM803_13360 [Rhodocyclaceae bacterium]
MKFHPKFKTLFVKVTLAVFGALTVSVPYVAQAATSKQNKATPAKQSKASATTKKAAPASKKASATPSKSKTASKLTSKTATSSAKASDSAAKCRTVRVKTSKGYTNKRVCSAAPAPEPALQNSPIKENALTAVPAAGAAATEVKARNVPDRAYAVDGETFFHQGRKFRVQGIPPGALAAGGDHAKQKLQMALDAGSISVDPVGVDATGTATAVVRVNGRNVADTLRADLPPQTAGAPGSRTTMTPAATPDTRAQSSRAAANEQASSAPASSSSSSSASSSQESDWGAIFHGGGEGISPGAMGD